MRGHFIDLNTCAAPARALSEAARLLEPGATLLVRVTPARSSGWVYELRNWLARKGIRRALGARFRARIAARELAPEHPLRVTLERYLRLANAQTFARDLLAPLNRPIEIAELYALTVSAGLELDGHSSERALHAFERALIAAAVPAEIVARFAHMTEWEKLSLVDDLCELGDEPVYRFRKSAPRAQISRLPSVRGQSYFAQGSQLERMREGLASGAARLDPDGLLTATHLALVLKARVDDAGQVVPGLSSGDFARFPNARS